MIDYGELLVAGRLEEGVWKEVMENINAGGIACGNRE
jgi:hypothetical protein